MRVQKERGENAEQFKISSDGEQDDEGVLEGEPPFEDLPQLKEWEDKWAGLSGEGFADRASQAVSSQSSSALGDQKQAFFPSSKPKAKPAMSSAKTNTTVKGD